MNEVWQRLTIEELARLFKDADKPFWISGGVAIDLSKDDASSHRPRHFHQEKRSTLFSKHTELMESSSKRSPWFWPTQKMGTRRNIKETHPQYLVQQSRKWP